MPDPADNSAPPTGEELRREVEARAARKLQARRETHHSIWFGLGMFGMIGWSVSVPTLAGVGIGWWLDRHYPSRYSCTLMGLAIGLVVGCLLAWQWIQRESREDETQSGRKS